MCIYVFDFSDILRVWQHSMQNTVADMTIEVRLAGLAIHQKLGKDE